MRDFIDETRNTSSLHLRFLLGDGNAILPATRASTRFREVCQAEEGTLDPPRQMLDFQINELTNPARVEVCAQIVDIETGKIIAKRRTEAAGTDDAALAVAIQNSAVQLAEDGVTVGPLSDGKAR